MTKKTVRSIKGEMVDFDLSEVKQKIGNKAPTTDVTNRERYIHSKRRRGSRKAVNKALEKNVPKKQDKVVLEPTVAEKDTSGNVNNLSKKETKKKIVKKTKRKN